MDFAILSRALWLLFHKSFGSQIENSYDKNFSKEVMRLAKKNYFKIISNPPVIGKHNPMLINILFAAFVASVYKAGNGKISPAKMGVIMSDGVEQVSLFKKFIGINDYFSKSWQDKRHRQTLQTQKREYPDDFVCEFIYGETFDEYGINYYECALFKLLKREGCPELAPQMCKFDYVMAKYMNADFKRTKSLATGGDFCDLRYSKKTLEKS
ncbi:MAG: L-2-amino-thiazoline-4-carboxylic acid hydrolase [Bacillota bacterium]|nr:L-2-amino-thiazoline-4-carboxylic acid hydrolase [Bacillota bacterium]